MGDRIPAFWISRRSPHVIMVDSVSKRFNACGARIGALITANDAVFRGRAAPGPGSAFGTHGRAVGGGADCCAIRALTQARL